MESGLRFPWCVGHGFRSDCLDHLAFTSRMAQSRIFSLNAGGLIGTSSGDLVRATVEVRVRVKVRVRVRIRVNLGWG